ncbi:uncharacterized protein LOC101859687 [Aplysia californica]|uniref:Uncharacterized protein LOC101859687 n=1 Tax=Aplysia californica TaxID=6500 RepID=A0ABM0KAX6_APLCA|nr:uncharacterized protein LOC101859687 [Aplysia californica]XP_005113199.1 uncharacterized protein LOC101859687 [Aplysia californica]XP_035829553.1 uncharacterized protein LOC101859687 [Aplysia californica]
MRKHLCLYSAKLLWLLMLAGPMCESKVSNVFLNSYYHCGHDKTYEVNPNSGYLVMPDVSPDSRTHTFRDCEVTFHSARQTGNLCVSQEGSLSRIMDSNAELSVYDGYGDDKPKVFTLGYYPDEWAYREVCTNSPYLHFYIRRKDKTVNVNVRNMKLLFKVLDIESKDRTLYFDEQYCDGNYKLKKSWVNVLNRLPPSSTGEGREAKEICGFELDKEPRDGRRFCVVYVPLENFDCSSGWELSVSSKPRSLKRQFFVFSLSCSESRARKTQVWCGSNSTDSYSLIMQRKVKGDSVVEPARMFRLIVTDYDGSVESLRAKVEAELRKGRHESEGLGTVYIALIIALVVGGLVLLAAIVYKVRHKMPWYHAVHNPGSEKEDV